MFLFVVPFFRILNNYLIWRLAQTYAQDLSWEYVHANREFYVATTGRAEFLGTWRFCFYLVSDKMKEALSAMFVRDHFADESKPKVYNTICFK
jgi:predicted metalloendopeptidase